MQAAQALVSGAPYVESQPLLAKIAATYDLLSDVVATERGPEVPSNEVEATLTRRWLDDYLSSVRGVSGVAWSPEPPPVMPTELVQQLDQSAIRVVIETDGSAWDEAHRRMFDEVLGNPGSDVDVVPASPAHVRTLRRAVEILTSTAPNLAAATLPHTTLLALVDGKHAFESASDRRLPRAIYLNRACCEHPLRSAEAMLHESVHQKLYDLQVVYTLYASNYKSESGPQIRPLWHPEGTQWPLDRCVAAAHVYVHLTAFYEQAVETGIAECATSDLQSSAEQARYRASMLLGAITNLANPPLNRHGIQFIDWLRRAHQHTTVTVA